MARTLADRLARAIKGRVLTDRVSRTVFSSGACLYRVEPEMVVQPAGQEDLRTVLRLAAREGVPVTARGGGTSRCGNELSSGIVLDFGRFMNRVLEINPEEGWARVEPGLILDRLNRKLTGTGLFFPIDPSTADVCTLGGMIANNSSGPRAVRYGTTRDHVLSLELVLADGAVVRTGPGEAAEGLAQEDLARKRLDGLEAGVSQILARYAAALETDRPEVVKNSAGYHLWDLERAGRLDLTPLLVGSEGTLGLISSAKLKLSPQPRESMMGLLHFDDLGLVGRATELIRELRPSMIEIIERRILDLARERIPAVRPYLPEGIEAILLVEFQGDQRSALEDSFRELERRLVTSGRLARGLTLARDKARMAELARVRAVSGPILNRAPGPRRPVAVVEDAAVHPRRLSEYIAGLRRIREGFRVDSGIYGHAGDGELHVMVFLDLSREEEVERMLALAEACHDLVLSLKGTISGEHGDGRLRTHWLARQYPHLSPAFAEVKALFDPGRLLNPGIIVPDGTTHPGRDLKLGPDRAGSPAGGLEAAFPADQLQACSGCRKCLAYCPAAGAIGQEWATGRAKVALLRELAAGRLDPAALSDPEFGRVMEACLNCKRCLSECPSGVDVPWLTVKARAERMAREGPALGDRLLAGTGSASARLGALAPLVNLANRTAPVRRLLELGLGLDPHRELPELQRRGLRDRLAGRPAPAGGSRPVVYFAGCLERYNHPSLGLDAVEVLEANGFEVLTPDLDCCGLAKISLGDLKEAAAGVERNARALAGFADRGLETVFSEPSCGLAVIQEYPKVLPGEASEKAAGHGREIHSFLLGLLDQGELNRDLGRLDLTVGYHRPCHLRALDGTKADLALLRLIPGLKVVEYPDLCCGLAGTFGLKSRNYRLSMDIGRELFQAVRSSGVELVATACGACGLQIGHGTGLKTTTPVSLLARAYRKAAGAKEGR